MKKIRKNSPKIKKTSYPTIAFAVATFIVALFLLVSIITLHTVIPASNIWIVVMMVSFIIISIILLMVGIAATASAITATIKMNFQD